MVVANRGESHILGVGHVTDGGYRFLEGVDRYNHSLAVEWDTSAERDIPMQRGWQPTVVNLTPAKLTELGITADADVAGSHSWIFQSNPTYYDIDGAVAALPEQSWRIGQYASEIKAGHEVFLWRTGPQAGVIAVGTVKTDPADMEKPETENPFVRDPARFDGIFRRSMVRIDRRVTPPLLKRHDPTSDVYQALAYAKGLGLRVVALVYPEDGEVAPMVHEIRSDETVVLVRTIPVGRGLAGFRDLDRRTDDVARQLVGELLDVGRGSAAA